MVDDVNKGPMLPSNTEKSDTTPRIVFGTGTDMLPFRFLTCYYKLKYCYKTRKSKLQSLGLRLNMPESEWRTLKQSKSKKLISPSFKNLRVVLYCLVNHPASLLFLAS